MCTRRGRKGVTDPQNENEKKSFLIFLPCNFFKWKTHEEDETLRRRRKKLSEAIKTFSCNNYHSLNKVVRTWASRNGNAPLTPWGTLILKKHWNFEVTRREWHDHTIDMPIYKKKTPWLFEKIYEILKKFVDCLYQVTNFPRFPSPI